MRKLRANGWKDDAIAKELFEREHYSEDVIAEAFKAEGGMGVAT